LLLGGRRGEVGCYRMHRIRTVMVEISDNGICV
jgi:hypothetical protein